MRSRALKDLRSALEAGISRGDYRSRLARTTKIPGRPSFFKGDAGAGNVPLALRGAIEAAMSLYLLAGDGMNHGSTTPKKLEPAKKEVWRQPNALAGDPGANWLRRGCG